MDLDRLVYANRLAWMESYRGMFHPPTLHNPQRPTSSEMTLNLSFVVDTYLKRLDLVHLCKSLQVCWDLN